MNEVCITGITSGDVWFALLIGLVFGVAVGAYLARQWLDKEADRRAERMAQALRWLAVNGAGNPSASKIALRALADAGMLEPAP